MTDVTQGAASAAYLSCVEAQLRNGAGVRIRRIRPDDKRRLQAGLRASSAESVHRRFMGPKPRLSEAELEYLTEVDFRDHYALVAVAPDTPDGLAGVGRWVRNTEKPDEADFAIIVSDELHRQGLGTAITLALMTTARRRGIRRFTATMFADNRPAYRLFARVSTSLAVEDDGYVREVVAELPAATRPPVELPRAA